MKQAIAARSDLDMGTGKVAAQVAHAALRAATDAAADVRREWDDDGATKVVVRVDGERAVFDLADAAERAGLPHSVVRDAGRTELEPGTVTAVAVGPGADAAVDEVTGHLPLY